MAKHTQAIRRKFANELFECVWPFCGTGAYRVNVNRKNLGSSKKNGTRDC